MKFERKGPNKVRAEKEKLVLENFASVMSKLDATFLVESGLGNTFSEYFHSINHDPIKNTYTFVTQNDLEYYTTSAGEIYDGDGWMVPNPKDEMEISKFFQEKGGQVSEGEVDEDMPSYAVKYAKDPSGKVTAQRHGDEEPTPDSKDKEDV